MKSPEIEALITYTKKLAPSLAQYLTTELKKVQEELENNYFSYPKDMYEQPIYIGDLLRCGTNVVKVVGVGYENDKPTFCGEDEYGDIRSYETKNWKHVDEKDPEEMVFKLMSNIINEAVESWAHGNKFYLTRESIRDVTNHFKVMDPSLERRED